MGRVSVGCIRRRRAVCSMTRMRRARTGAASAGAKCALQESGQATPPQGAPRRGEEAAEDAPGDEGLEEPLVERQVDSAGRLWDREAAWGDNFRKLQVDGEVHRDDLGTAIFLCSHVQPNRRWISEILEQLTQYSSVGFEEFIEFNRRYTERQKKAYLEVFGEHSRSSKVTSADVGGVLKSLGLNPMDHVVAELLPEVGVDPGGTVEESQFLALAELLSRREGFTTSEFEEFMEIFTRFDWDCSGRLSIREVRAVLTFLGYTWGRSRVAELVAEVDIDRSGNLDEREFMMCMRLIREHEVRSMQQAAAEHPQKPDWVLSSLGYPCPDRALLLECLTDAGAGEAPSGDLSPSAMWRMVRAYRLRSGWSAELTEEFRAAFDKQDREGSGEICPSRLGMLLRQVGYGVPFDRQRKYFESAAPSFDGSSFPMLSFEIFLKVLHLLRQSEMAEYKRRFGELLAQERTPCAVTTSLAVELLAELGLDAEDNELGARVDLRDFLSEASRLAAQERETRAMLRGFSARQFRDMSQAFRERAADGAVNARDLAAILEQVYPDLPTGEGFRGYLQRAAVEDADEDPLELGRITYGRFVQIVELFGAFEDEHRLRKEEAARRGASFRGEEVAGFRDLFLATSENGVSLCFEELRRMLRQIVPLCEASTARLQEIVRASTATAAPRAHDAESGSPSARAAERDRPWGRTPTSRGPAPRDVALDFPDFLCLMQALIDQDFAGLRRAAAPGAAEGGPRGPPRAGRVEAGTLALPPQALPKRLTDPGSPRRFAGTRWSCAAVDPDAELA